MSTWKNTHSPAGMHFSSCGTQNINLIDCPKCKFGTLDRKNDKTMKCADCKQEYSVDELVRLHVLPNDQKLSHAAGDCRQPEARSEN
jgi:hypothetical protein